MGLWATLAVALAAATAPPELPVRVAYPGDFGQLHIAERRGERTVIHDDSLTLNDHGYLRPRWSPDGRRLAYWRWDRKRATLFVDDVRGDRIRADEAWQSGEGQFAKRRVRLTSQPRALTPPLRARLGGVVAADWPGDELQWSPRGTFLAYVRPDSRIVVERVDGRGRRSYRAPPLDDDYDDTWTWLDLGWSPDERFLTVGTATSDGTWLLRLRDGRLTKLAPRGAVVRDPAWSPDSTKIAYSRGDARGNAQLRVLDVRTGRTAKLTNDVPLDPHAHFSNVNPAWSPDGRRVAFLSNRDDARDLDVYVVGADGRGQRRLTHGLAVRNELRWSRDGKQIAFVGWDPYIGIVSANGGRPIRVIAEPSEEPAAYDFAWRPASAVRPVAVPLPSHVPPNPIRVVRDHAPRGNARLVDIRRLGRIDGDITDLSRDGRYLVVFRHVDERFHLVQPAVVDLATGRARRVGRVSQRLRTEGGLLSPDSRSLVIHQRGRMRVLDVATGRERFAAARGARVVRWLDDGRLAYLSRGRQLMFARPGGRVTGTGVWLPETEATPSLALDGRAGRLVYVDARCRTWLVDRATERRRRLPDALLPTPQTFSPSGSHLALRSAWATCAEGSHHVNDIVVYRADGLRLAQLFGVHSVANHIDVSWTPDGRRLLAAASYGGTRPEPPRVYAYDLASTRLSPIARGVWGDVFAGPGGWVVWRDDDWNPSQRGFELRLARLVDRERNPGRTRASSRHPRCA